MAPPSCMSEDGNNAVFVGTMLQTGDAVALCDECLVPWTAAMLQMMTGVDPAPFLAAVSEPGEAAGEPAVVDLDGGPQVETAHGAPTDRPPHPAPADADEGAAAEQSSGDPPPRKSRKRAVSA